MKNRLTILNYHRVPETADVYYQERCDRAVFRNQLQSLGRFFNVLPADEAVRLLFEGRLPSRAVVITFDDGYQNNYTVALEELQRASLPAIFFIATDFLDGGLMWNDAVIETLRRTRLQQLPLGEFGLSILPTNSEAERLEAINKAIPVFKYMPAEVRTRAVARLVEIADVELPDDQMMSSDQVRALSKTGMQIGGHTATHPILLNQTAEQSRDDIQRGSEYLRSITGQRVSLFAYPNGKRGQDYDESHVAMLEDMGFDAAFTTHWGYADASSPAFELPRIGFADYQGWRFTLRLMKSYFDAAPVTSS